MLEHAHLAPVLGLDLRRRLLVGDRLGVVDGAPAALHHHVRQREVVAEARVDLDVVGPAHGVDRAVAAGDRAERRLLLRAARSRSASRRPRGSSPPRRSSTSRPQTYATSGSAKERTSWRARPAPTSRSRRRRRRSRRIVSRTARSCAATLPAARAAEQPNARLACRDRLDQLVGAVVGGVGGDDDLEPVGGVVEREQVLQPPLDHRLLVVGGDDHGHARVARHRRGRAGGATRASGRGGERVPGVRPDEGAERRPEDDLNDDTPPAELGEHRLVAARSRSSGRPPPRRTRAPGGPSRRGRTRRRARPESRARAQTGCPAGRRRRSRPRDELRRLALGVGGGDHRPAGGEDAVEAARDDVAGQPAGEPDDVDVGGRERQRAADRAAARAGIAPCPPRAARERDELLPARAGADDHAPRGRRGRGGRSQARISASRFCAWPMLPECMTTKRFASLCSRAHGCRAASARRRRRRPSSGSRGCAPARRPSPPPGASSSRRSRPRGRRSGATGRSAGAATRTTIGLRSRPSLTAISGKTSCVITSSGARKRAATRRAIAPMNGGSVMQTTRSGRRANIALPEHPDHVREVVQRPAREPRALVGGRADAHDLDAVALLPGRGPRAPRRRSRSRRSRRRAPRRAR